MDTFCDLLVRDNSGNLHVYWGARDGLNPQRVTRLAAADFPGGPANDGLDPQKKYAEYVADATPLPKTVRLGNVVYLFLVRPGNVYLIPVTAEREFGKPIVLACPGAMSVAAGDVNGDTHCDLVFACRARFEGKERSWIYWGNEQGYDNARRTPLPSTRACDVAVGDLDADGCDDIILCQCHTSESFTTVSPVYRGTADGPIVKAVALQCEDARRVFVARTSSQSLPEVVFVNYQARGKLGNPEVPIYLGGVDGYDPDRAIRVSAWGSVEALFTDFYDRGRVDLLLANASENSVNRDPGSFLFLGTTDGLPRTASLKLPTTRAHGVGCADLNRDGYLDLVFCGFDNPELRFFYGTPNGFDTTNPACLRLECDGKVFKDPRWGLPGRFQQRRVVGFGGSHDFGRPHDSPMGRRGRILHREPTTAGRRAGGLRESGRFGRKRLFGFDPRRA